MIMQLLLTRIAGYLEYTTLNNKLFSLETDDFALFTDPENHVGRLIILHTLLLSIFMSRKAVEALGPQHLTNALKTVAVLWINKIKRTLPEQYKPYAEWAVSCSNNLDFEADNEAGIWKPFLLQDIPHNMPRMDIF